MTVFIDANVLVANANIRDSCHARADVLLNEIIKLKFGKPFTSDYIFDEIVTVLMQKTKDMKRTKDYGERLIDGEIEILTVDEHIFKEAWTIFKEQGQTKLSFTDCTNLAIMRTHNIQHIATFDQAYKKQKNISVID